jgi:cyclic beta-1,2-glucan synthetase
MYQLILESYLGLRRDGNTVTFKPCIPKDWKSFQITYRYDEAVYHIKVDQTGDETASRTVLDGIVQPHDTFELIKDTREHFVVITINGSVASASTPSGELLPMPNSGPWLAQ